MWPKLRQPFAVTAALPRGESRCAPLLCVPLGAAVFEVSCMAAALVQIHLRTSPKTKALLVSAARLSGASSLADYVLRAARERAQGILSAEGIFVLTTAQWDEFSARLDASPRDRPRLRRLLTEPGIFTSS